MKNTIKWGTYVQKAYRTDRNQIEVSRYYSLFLVTFWSDPYLKEKL